MPIEIRELVIRTTVSEGSSAPSTNTSSGGVDQDELVQEITDKVIDIMNRKLER